MDTIESEFKKILLRLRLKKTKGSIIRLTILAHEHLVRQGFTDAKVQTGYAIWGTHGCWHIWIECNGIQLDAGQSIVKIPVTLVDKLPEGTVLMGDSKTFQEEYELWLEDPKKYFKCKS